MLVNGLNIEYKVVGSVQQHGVAHDRVRCDRWTIAHLVGPVCPPACQLAKVSDYGGRYLLPIGM